MSKCPLIKLNNGLTIPQVGLGVSHILPNELCEKSCLEAFTLGYRLIDTAHIYQNEKGVGNAVKKSGLNREDLFITSKLWVTEYGEGKTAEAIDKMLIRLDLDYIDLVLLHWPFGDYIGAWKDLEKAVEAGKIKSIGLSNFDEFQINEIISKCKIKPVINQIECHPFKNMEKLMKKMEVNEIHLEAWYPLGSGKDELIKTPLLDKLSEKYKKSKVQIILRWHIQCGHIIIPKAQNPVHKKENFNIFDFELTDEEINEINNFPQKNLFVPKGGSIETFREWALTNPPKDE